MPGAWWVSSFADHILMLLFGMPERHRQDPSRPFDLVAREEVERIEWGDQDYGREHLHAIGVRVYEEIERLESTRRA